MNEAEKKPESPPKPPQWLDDDDADGGGPPHWAELPRLQIGDQASASMAIRFPALPETPELIPPPPGMIVVNDDFAGLRRLSNSSNRPAPRVEPPRIIPVPPPPPPRVVEPPVADVPSSPVRAPIVYGIVIRNTTAETMREVRVEHELPPGPRYIGADPSPQVQGRHLLWEVGDVEPGTKQRFKVTIQPNRPDEVPADAAAQFRVYQCLHSKTRVLRPSMTASLRLPEKANVGDHFAIVVEAVNTGPGSADDLRILLPLPAGLKHDDGAVVQFKHAQLGPGERLRFDVDISVEHGGEFTVPAHVFGNNKLMTSAQATLTVTGPGPVIAPPVVEPVAAPAEAAPVAPAYLLFQLADDWFALPAGRVREVRRAQPVTTRPRAPEWLIGSVELGDVSVPLVDLRRRLGLRTDGLGSRFLLIGDGAPAALLVDRTLGVRRLSPVPARVANGEFALATADDAGRRVTVLDLDRLLQAPELTGNRNAKP